MVSSKLWEAVVIAVSLLPGFPGSPLPSIHSVHRSDSFLEVLTIDRLILAGPAAEYSRAGEIVM